MTDTPEKNRSEQAPGPAGPPPWPRRVAAVLVSAAILCAGGLAVRVMSRGDPAREDSAEAVADAPQPPLSRLVFTRKAKGRLLVRYMSDSAPDRIIRFYRIEMSRRGWNERNLPHDRFHGEVLAFSQPGRSCIICVSESAAGAGTGVTVMTQRFRPDRPAAAPYKEIRP